MAVVMVVEDHHMAVVTDHMEVEVEAIKADHHMAATTTQAAAKEELQVEAGEVKVAMQPELIQEAMEGGQPVTMLATMFELMKIILILPYYKTLISFLHL
jgi:hypothetical protein